MDIYVSFNAELVTVNVSKAPRVVAGLLIISEQAWEMPKKVQRHHICSLENFIDVNVKVKMWKV